MTKQQIRDFVKVRVEAKLNNMPEEELKGWIDNCIITKTDYDFEMIDDGGHGYLIVPPVSSYYELAKKCESKYSRWYRLDDGTILLEEDCDATKFLSAIDKK